MANIQHTKAMAKAWKSKVKCLCLHPGEAIDKTNIMKDIDGCFKCILGCMACLGAVGEKTIPECTATQVFAAVSDEALKMADGEYLNNCQVEGLIHIKKYNEKEEQELMAYSQQLTDVTIKVIQ